MNGQPPKHFQPAVHLITRLVLGGVFLYAAISKMGSPQDLADSIASYRIVPYPVVNLWAVGLPLFELNCGLFLLTGYFCRIGLLSVMGLLILFLTAILSAELRGLPISCGCFGSQSWLDGNLWVSILRDIVLLLAAFHAYGNDLLRAVKSQPDNPARPA